MNMNLMGGFYKLEGEEEDAAAIDQVEREHMFDKVVTPSDVGKLNRLVIPKQHAEKYFPLDYSSSSGEKGLLLNFEDSNGKSWRFRYSYWNSSQSYVMTKGWSRFVKEKKLDAGDIVSFHRGPGDRLFIDWRRRPDAPIAPHSAQRPSLLFLPSPSHGYGYGIVTGNPCPPYLMSSRPINPPLLAWPHINHPQHQQQQQMVFDSVPVVQGKAAAAANCKRLRLFGVNMDYCPTEDENISSSIPLQLLPSSSSSSSTLPHHDDNTTKGKASASMSLDLDI